MEDEDKRYETKTRLRFLKDRLHIRHDLFMEWLFVDNTIITDYEAFVKRTKEIEEEVKTLKRN